jgi:hypothetical protein
MKFQTVAVLFFLSTPVLSRADSKADLDQSRSDYRQAVQQYGAASPQAKSAKGNLRRTRKSFHSERRQRSTPPRENNRGSRPGH